MKVQDLADSRGHRRNKMKTYHNMSTPTDAPFRGDESIDVRHFFKKHFIKQIFKFIFMRFIHFKPVRRQSIFLSCQ